VVPTARFRPSRSTALPRLSAQSCANQRARSRSRSLYGISTTVCVDARGLGEVEHRREEQRRVLPQDRRARALIHPGGAGEHVLDADAAHRGGKEAGGGEHREAARDAGRHREVAEALVVDDLAQATALGVGGDDDARLVLDGAERAQQPVADDEELGDRRRRLARFAHHVEGGAGQVEVVEQRADAPRIDVVGHHDARRAAAERAAGCARLPSAEPPTPRTTSGVDLVADLAREAR
jgi:hypothetical protein